MPMYEVKIRVTTVQVLNIEAKNEADAEGRAYDETPYDTYDEDPEVKAELVND
jgi:hypothetical protein